MSKRLENFIKNNSDDFDDLEPGNDLWNNIESKIPVTDAQQQPKREAKTFTLGFVMRVAALVIITMAIGFIFYIKNERVDAPTPKVAASFSSAYAQQQAHYASLVEIKRTELKVLKQTDPQLYKEFSGEIAKMDSTYKKLNRDLATSPDQEKVLRAMIRNLQIQTDVLNQQLQVIEQFNQSKKDQHHALKNI